MRAEHSRQNTCLGYESRIMKCCDTLVSGANSVPSHAISGPSGDPWSSFLSEQFNSVKSFGLLRKGIKCGMTMSHLIIFSLCFSPESYRGNKEMKRKYRDQRQKQTQLYAQRRKEKYTTHSFLLFFSFPTSLSERWLNFTFVSPLVLLNRYMAGWARAIWSVLLTGRVR